MTDESEAEGRGAARGWRAGIWAVAAAGAVAVASLVGWLEEVARSQAVEQYFGLPLTAAADPRAAAAFAALPLAVAVGADLLLLGAVVEVANRRWWAGVVAVALAGVVLLSPPRSWAQILVEGVIGVAVAVVVCAAVVVVRDRVTSLSERAAAWAARWHTSARVRRPSVRPAELRWIGRVMVAAILVAAVVYVPLWIGDQVGRGEARDTTTFFVVADRACDPATAVLWLGNESGLRRVRIARRTGGVWTLAPGILTVGAGEPVAQVRLGKLARSDAADYPLPAQPSLPVVCSR